MSAVFHFFPFHAVSQLLSLDAVFQLFGIYVSLIGDVISQHNVEYHQYADDMQLYVSLSPADFGNLSTIESCASDVSRWFVENALFLNPTKTEAVIFSERELTFTFAICCRPSVCRLSVCRLSVCRL